MKQVKTEHVYKDLKEFRLDRGMNQAAMAKELGITQGMVSSYENEKRKITDEFRESFQKAFGHMGYKVKGINDQADLAPKKPELPKADKVVIEKLKERVENSQGRRNEGKSRVVSKPKEKPNPKPKVVIVEKDLDQEVANTVEKMDQEEKEELKAKVSIAEPEHLVTASFETPEMIARENSKVYLIDVDGKKTAYIDKRRAAVVSWNLAMEDIEHDIDEVEVE